jgi:two-component system, OmpR family, phosphate regulon sensor histidine kinase PhoR
MVIRSKALRLGILISTLLVATIIAVQLFWLQKVYYFEEKQFSANVSKSIKGLYEDMNLVEAHSNYNIEKLIENPKNDVYLVKIDSVPDIDSLRTTIAYELTDFGVFTDCRIAIYDPATSQYTGERYIDLPDTYQAVTDKTEMPYYKKDYSYAVLYFPHRSEYIIKQMVFWIVATGLLLLVLVGFGGSVFYLYRQNFLNETQNDFVNNFTHEFKTPLSVIKIAADVLQQPSITDKPDKLNKYAGIIGEQTAHLQKQVQRLLEIAFTDQRFLPIMRDNFNVNDMIEQAINDLQPLIEERHVNITTNFAIEHAVIYADKTHLLLVVINLIENAVKYSLNPVIEISTYTKDSYFCISVKDNGVGIGKEHQKKIFDRFYRVTNGNIQSSEGFGLGLNFVKKVVEAHFGKIEVQSDTGKGTTIIIKIIKSF